MFIIFIQSFIRSSRNELIDLDHLRRFSPSRQEYQAVRSTDDSRGSHHHCLVRSVCKNRAYSWRHLQCWEISGLSRCQCHDVDWLRLSHGFLQNYLLVSILVYLLHECFNGATLRARQRLLVSSFPWFQQWQFLHFRKIRNFYSRIVLSCIYVHKYWMQYWKNRPSGYPDHVSGPWGGVLLEWDHSFRNDQGLWCGGKYDYSYIWSCWRANYQHAHHFHCPALKRSSYKL